MSPARVPQLNSPHTPQVTLTETKQNRSVMESNLYIIKVGKPFWVTILFVNQGKLKTVNLDVSYVPNLFYYNRIILQLI